MRSKPSSPIYDGLVLNLGGCLSDPLRPRVTADLLMDRNWPTIHGNHGRAVAETPPAGLGQSDRIADRTFHSFHTPALPLAFLEAACCYCK